jgi:hypothetical protein
MPITVVTVAVHSIEPIAHLCLISTLLTQPYRLTFSVSVAFSSLREVRDPLVTPLLDNGQPLQDVVTWQNRMQDGSSVTKLDGENQSVSASNITSQE